MGAWFDDLPLDFSRAETRDAAKLLVIAYDSGPLALGLAQSVGIDTTAINHNQAVRDLMQDIMEAARLADRLPMLLKEATGDPRCAAIRDRLAKLLETPKPPVDPDTDAKGTSDGPASDDRAEGPRRGRRLGKWLTLAGGGLIAVAAIAALAWWLWPAGPLNIAFVSDATPRSGLMPGQRLAADLSAVPTRDDEPVQLTPAYAIKSASDACAADGGRGSWGVSIAGNSLTATVPFRLQNLLQACEVTVQASVAQGDETVTAEQTFVFTPAKRSLVQVEAGAFHGCALKASGDVLCWGGQGDLYGAVTPPQGLRARAIAAGTYSVCAILRGTGQVRCWGDGDPAAERSEVKPTERASIGPVAGIAAGVRVFCANFSDSTLDCWTSGGVATVKFEVDSLENVRIWQGRRACGMTDGDLICADFELATGGEPTVTGAPPTFWWGSGMTDKKIIDFTDPVGDHVCALLEDRTISCYVFSTGSVVDITDKFLPNTQSLIDNGQFLCALSDSGAINCSRIDALNPMPMSSLTEEIEGFKAVSIAAAHYYGLCAISADDKVKCWSIGDSSGNPYAFVSDVPDEISAEDPPPDESPPPSLGAINDFEAQLPRELIAQIQQALCVPADGLLGVKTRVAIVEFYNGAGDPRPSILRDGLKPADMVKLREAMQLSPTCNAPGAHTSASQLGQMVSG